MSTPRTRRSPEEARRLIMDAAAALLAEGGVAAVQVRAVAARVGMTDAGVTHHFGNRDKLLAELLRHGGRELRAALRTACTEWLEHGADLLELVEALEALYRRGYGELAVALHAAGWRDPGSGMLDPVVDALHRLRPRGSSLDDTRHAVAALHQAMATEALYGSAFRRSAGLTGPAANDSTAHVRWWARHLQLALGPLDRSS
ncbi:TetR family transcriptional regulator [Nocardia goodfellowii]